MEDERLTSLLPDDVLKIVLKDGPESATREEGISCPSALPADADRH
jgi:hypothetical protein